MQRSIAERRPRRNDVRRVALRCTRDARETPARDNLLRELADAAIALDEIGILSDTIE
jgi:hypothetical protein